VDQYYIDDDYYTPDGYFAYIAEAQAEPFSQFTLSASGDVIGGNSATLSAAANLTSGATRGRLNSASLTVAASTLTAAD